MHAEMPTWCGKDALNIMEEEEGKKKKKLSRMPESESLLSKMCFAIKSELSVQAELATTVLRLLPFC